LQSISLCLFGHIAQAVPSQDDTQAVHAAINRLPADWHQWTGRPRQTWLRIIELDLQTHSLGLNSAGPIKLVSARGDGYAVPRVRHPMMMMITTAIFG